MQFRSTGPSQQMMNNFYVPEQPKHIYQTSQRYQEYLSYFGKDQQPKQDVYSKLLDWKGRSFTSESLLLDPSKISPLLKALTDENTELKAECQKLSTDLGQFAMMVDRLIEDNSAIQKHLQMKQIEMTNFLETVTLNASEEVLDLKYQIQSLQEENNLHIKHLEEMRRNNNEGYIQNLQTEIQNAQLLYDQLNQNFTSAKEREEDLARELQSLKPQLYQANDDIQGLKSAIDGLEDQIHYLTQQKMLIENKYDLYQKQANTKIQTLEIQIDELTSREKSISRENAQLVLTIGSCEAKINDLIKQLHQVQAEKFNYQTTATDMTNKERELRFKLEVEKAKRQPTVEYIEDESVIKLRFQLDEAKTEYLKLDDFMNRQLDAQKKQSEQILENMKLRFTTSLNERTEQIHQLERQLESCLQETELLRKELILYQQEYAEIKSKNQEAIAIRKVIEAQQLDARQLKQQLADKKLLVNEMLEEKEQMVKLVKQEKLQWISQIQQLEAQLTETKTLLKPRLEEEMQRLQENYDHVQEQLHNVQNEYKDLIVEFKQIQQLNNKLTIEKGINLSEIDNLKSKLDFFQQQQQKRDKMNELLSENQILRSQLNK